MTRTEYEDQEGIAIAAMLGLLSGCGSLPPKEVAKQAFDYAEAMAEERKSRLGEKPPFSS
ncbi:TPA: hypothetical protein QEM76_000191 [Pseudomonas putida]|uniref:hypothetical protein n=1 Tax=Pseudomonas kurunegalensis TaxID=485880 RepID=UPI0032FDF8F7|nr:hypothetical protein [Pseudomonas putida]HDS1803538.1 hypothetical protein [Pseudomonas putida]